MTRRGIPQVWTDARTVNVIATACLAKVRCGFRWRVGGVRAC